MARKSAGLLMYRYRDGVLQVLLVHLGGPYWAGKEKGAWSIPKGEYEPDEDPLSAAQREFEEETGFKPGGHFIPLKPARQRSGKIIAAWAFEGDCDPAALKSNTFRIEWPPHSGKIQIFPEIDRAAWFDIRKAKEKISPGQVDFLSDLEQIIFSQKSKKRAENHNP
ncbi:MAG: NUDIX domain-containing protein [Nitrospirota bacterium]